MTTSSANMPRSSKASTLELAYVSKDVYIAKGEYSEYAKDGMYVLEGKYREYAWDAAFIEESNNEPLATRVSDRVHRARQQ
jgi:hypothetical protein